MTPGAHKTSTGLVLENPSLSRFKSVDMMSSDSFQPPLQLKGEIMDLEFTADTDHRKRRRNRTTQSCLNCHTSKRKCDRKRPCQRCIQLGLTGLCVYEIDDVHQRDDPSVDENTRLRNRIAELESLVRELRGKPHPRWADANFRDGDPSERWHSRASKGQPPKRRGQSPAHEEERDTRSVVSNLLTPIKTEPAQDVTQSHLYRFSPSPGPSIRYQSFPGNPSPPLSTFEPEQRQSYDLGNSVTAPRVPYRSSSSNSGVSYNGHHHSGHSSYQNNGNGYHVVDCEDGRTYDHYTPDSSPPHSYCNCRTNPAASHALIALTHQLRNTLQTLRQCTTHPPDSSCPLHRRLVELNEIMHQDTGDSSGSPYGALPTPTESEILTPLSASSTPYHAPSSTNGTSPQDWSAIAAAGYNPYFPIPQGEHAMYNNVIS